MDLAATYPDEAATTRATLDGPNSCNVPELADLSLAEQIDKFEAELYVDRERTIMLHKISGINKPIHIAAPNIIEAKKKLLTELGIITVPYRLLEYGRPVAPKRPWLPKAPEGQCTNLLEPNFIINGLPFDSGDQPYGIGIRTGEQSGVCCVDIDNKGETLEIWNRFMQKFQRLLWSVPCENTPGGGKHHYFDYNKDVPRNIGCIYLYENGEYTGRNVSIELKANSFVTCSPTINPINGRQYKDWDKCSWNDVGPGPMPKILVDLFKCGAIELTTMRPCERPSYQQVVGKLPGSDVFRHDISNTTPEHLGAILDALLEIEGPTYEMWLDALMCVAGFYQMGHTAELRLSMYDMADQWCAKSDYYTCRSDIEAKLDSFNTIAVGFTKLYSYLSEDVIAEIKARFKVGRIIRRSVTDAHKHGYCFDSEDGWRFGRVTDEFTLGVQSGLTDLLDGLRRSIVFIRDTQSFVVRFKCGQSYYLKTLKQSEFYLFAGNYTIKLAPDNKEGFTSKKKLKEGQTAEPIKLKLNKIVRLYLNDFTYESSHFIAYSPVTSPNSGFDPKLIFNTFTGFPQQYNAEAELDQRPIDVWNYHINEVLANGNLEMTEYINNWVAHSLQKPHLKTKVLLALESPQQQVGKGIFTNFLVKHLFGMALGMTTHRFEDLIGKFTAASSTRLLIVLDEATFVGDKKSADMLKHLISEDTMSVERKGIDAAANMPNYANYIVCTNNQKFLHFDSQSRRLAVTRVSDKKCNDVKYFAEYEAALYNPEGAFTIYNYLLRRDISEFNPRKIPQTDALKAAIVHTIFEEWCIAIRDGSWASPKPNKGRMSVSMLFKDFTYFVGEHNFKQRSNIDTAKDMLKHMRDDVGYVFDRTTLDNRPNEWVVKVWDDKLIKAFANIKSPAGLENEKQVDTSVDEKDQPTVSTFSDVADELQSKN